MVGVLSVAVALLALALAIFSGSSAADAASSYPGQGILPENRAWEMVSPADKNGGEVTRTVPDVLLRPDGDAIAYNARVGFPGSAGATGIRDTYISSRDGEDGWSTRGAASSFGNASGEAALAIEASPSPDLSRSLFQLAEGPLSPVPPYDSGAPTDCSAHGVIGYCNNTYLIDYADMSHHLLTPLPHGAGFDIEMGSGSPDYSHYVFTHGAPLLPGAALNQLYEYELETGTLREVGIDEADDPLLGGPVEIAGGPEVGVARNGFDHFRSRPVSDDGGRIYFQQDPPGPDFGLYMREQTTETFRVNRSEKTVPTPSPNAMLGFVGASRDGSVAFFHTNEALVDADTDTTADLYRWELSEDPANDDNLTLISIDEEAGDADGLVNQGAEGGLVGIDDTGDIAYFTSNSQLVDGEPTGEERYLYRWTKNGGKEYIAPLLAADSGDNWQGISGDRQRVYNNTPDGRFALILSSTQITGDDSDSVKDAYLYDSEAAADPWTCVSCAGDIATTGPVEFRFQKTSYTAKGMSDDGRRVFFESADPLTPGDGNGMRDVFLWTDGEVHRISGGNAMTDSDFVGTDGEGTNAFFLTDEPLSGWDVDMNRDVYNARIDGGFPEPAIGGGCNGDGCQEDPSGAPTLEPIGSDADFAGNNPPVGAPDCSRIERRAKKAKRQSKGLKRKAKRARSTKKTKRLKRKAQAKKRKAKKLQRRLSRCQEGSR